MRSTSSSEARASLQKIEKLSLSDDFKSMTIGQRLAYAGLRPMVQSEAFGMFKSDSIQETIVGEGKRVLIAEAAKQLSLNPQLVSESYDVKYSADGDKDKIFDELKKLVGAVLSVTIIGATPKEGKLIFSEKSPDQKEKQEIVSKYEVGDALNGTVTGVVDFGVFIKLEEGLEGLVHISEIDWGLVEDPRALYKVGDKVKVKVIEVKDGKVSLSIKALKDNPWKEAEKKYKKDMVVEGVIIKYNKHGALASIEEGVAGLVHISEFENEAKLRSTLELGKTYKFKITLFDAKDQKMALSFAK